MNNGPEIGNSGSETPNNEPVFRNADLYEQVKKAVWEWRYKRACKKYGGRWKQSDLDWNYQQGMTIRDVKMVLRPNG